MAALKQRSNPEIAFVSGAVRTTPTFYDTRFRRLIGEAKWAILPDTVRARFSKRLGPSSLAIYQGVIIETRHSRVGCGLAHAARLVGAPLPLHGDSGVPASVVVSDDRASGGQCWTRIYGREAGFPQVIHSAKRFAGSTGLEEYLGRRIGMALTIVASHEGLEFHSDHYFVMIMGRRLRLPSWAGPGSTIVTHCDLGEGRFAFDLTVRHPLFGELVHQHAEFHDA